MTFGNDHGVVFGLQVENRHAVARGEKVIDQGAASHACPARGELQIPGPSSQSTPVHQPVTKKALPKTLDALGFSGTSSRRRRRLHRARRLLAFRSSPAGASRPTPAIAAPALQVQAIGGQHAGRLAAPAWPTMMTGPVVLMVEDCRGVAGKVVQIRPGQRALAAADPRSSGGARERLLLQDGGNGRSRGLSAQTMADTDERAWPSSSNSIWTSRSNALAGMKRRLFGMAAAGWDSEEEVSLDVAASLVCATALR